MKRTGLVLLALLAACGDDVSDGGSSEPEPSRRERLCRNLCLPMASCGVVPANGLGRCVDLCVADSAQSDERLGACVNCVTREGCGGLFGSCAETCATPNLDLALTLADAPGGKLHARVTDPRTGAFVASGAARVPEGGDVTLVIEGGLAADGAFRVEAFLDVDDDGACEDGEPGYRIDHGPTADGLTLALTPEAAAAVCPSFAEIARDVRFFGEGFSPEGALVELHLQSDLGDMPVWGQAGGAVGADGTFRLELEEIVLPDSAVDVAWYVDADGDWMCSAADAGGQATVEGPHDRHVELRVTPEDAGAPSCARFPSAGGGVMLEVEGLGAYEGRAVQAVLLQGDSFLAGSAGVVLDGRFVGALNATLWPGNEYRIALWVDADSDGACGGDDPRTWLEAAGDGTSPVNLRFTYGGERDASACAPHAG